MKAVRRLCPQVVVAGTLVALPAVFFYAILFRKAIELPLEDDYEALLDFLNNVVALHGTRAKSSYFLASMFNEYKLFFGHAVAWVQLLFIGHVSIWLLCAIGNAFVFLLAIVLWKMFLPGERLSYRLTAFIPVSCLLFQLSYAETLNWSMPGLQNIPVIFFSLAAIYLFTQSSRSAFIWGLVALTLSIASSGNGFFLIPVCALILVRNSTRLIWLVAVSLGCIAAYAYRYSVTPSQSQGSMLSRLLHFNPLYVLAFIGSAAEIFPSRISNRVTLALCITLGVLLCLLFIALLSKGYFGRNPAICYSALFVLVTAAGVSILRQNFGIAYSLHSRYKIYSALLLIFAWCGITEEIPQYRHASPWKNRLFVSVVLLTAVYCIAMDRRGWRYLGERNGEIIAGMTTYEHAGVGPVLPFPQQGARFDELDNRAPKILEESIRLGVYRPHIF